MTAPSRSRDNGEAPASLLSDLSLNCFKLQDLAGLPALLCENRPHFIFLQEVGLLPSFLVSPLLLATLCTSQSVTPPIVSRLCSLEIRVCMFRCGGRL